MSRLYDSRKRILVTGGAGFLGSHLADRLLDQGHEVICVDNMFTGTKRNIEHLLSHTRFEFIRHDITLPLYLEVDEIYNLACPASPIHYQHDPVQTTKTSVHGAINMLGLAKRLGCKIFQASTSEVYGDPSIHPQPEEYWGNVNPIGLRACYDEGKRCAETLFFDYHRQHGVKIKVARIFNTYGPRMHHADGRVVSNFIVQAIRGEPISVYGKGQQTRSFCYVDDLLEGLIKLMNSDDKTTGPINIGNPLEFTIHQLAEKVIELTGSSSKIIYKPLPKDDPQQRQPNIDSAKAVLNWSPTIDLETGLARTIKYFERSMIDSGLFNIRNKVSNLEVQELLNEAASAAVSGDLLEAEQLAKEALMLDYFDVTVREVLAGILRQQNRFFEAKLLFPVPERSKKPKKLKMVPQSADHLRYNTGSKGEKATYDKRFKVLENSRSYTLASLSNIDQIPEKLINQTELQKAGQTIYLPNTFVNAFDNARITRNGAFCTENFEFFNTSRVGRNGVKHIKYAPNLGWHVDLAEEPTLIDEPLFAFQRHPMNNYYHMVVEMFPALMSYKKLFKTSDCRVLCMPTTLLKLVKEFCKIIELPTEVLCVTDSSYVTAPVLYRQDAAEHIESKSTFLTSAALEMLEYLTKRVNGATSELLPKRIFISRKDSPKRSMVNESEVCAVLQHYGFEEVTLSGMDFSDQIELFAQAEFVVGAHGAGLTNVGFCRPGAHVLELTRTFTLERIRIFWELASARGLKYSVLNSNDDVKDHSAPFEADIASLRRWCDAFCA